MNTLQKISEYPISITEIKLFYQCMLEIGLQADKTFGKKRERYTTDHKLIWPLTYFNARSWTDEGAVFHNLKLDSAFNIQFIYRRSVKDHYSIGKYIWLY